MKKNKQPWTLYIIVLLVLLAIIALVRHFHIKNFHTIVPGTLYIVIYTVVVLFAMARNMLDVPYAWLIRPRFYVYTWFLVETYWWPGTINYLLWACVAVLTVKLLTGFLRIRGRI